MTYYQVVHLLREKNFNYGTQFTNYPPPSSKEGLTELSPEVSVASIENSTPINKPPSPVSNVPNEPDSNPDPNSSDSPSSY